MARESRHYEIRPEGPCALPKKDFSRSPSVHRFYQSKLVEAVSGTDIANNFIEMKIVGYLRDACVIAVKVSSSSVEPHRTLSDKLVYGFFIYSAVRT